jgi:hypothetical protein
MDGGGMTDRNGSTNHCIYGLHGELPEMPKLPKIAEIGKAFSRGFTGIGADRR